MQLSEYELIKNRTYREQCKHYQDKYGIPEEPYFDKNWNDNKKIKRSAEGLFIHHILEDEIPNLSNNIVAEEAGEKYQLPEALCYVDYLEHFYLHLSIAKSTSFFAGLGLGGCKSYMQPDLESFYKNPEVFHNNLTYGKATYNKAYYEKIKDDEDVFTILNSLYDEIFEGRNKTLEHNAILYREVENLLDTRGKCLVELGTGLGKSTIVLQYLDNHPDMKALVIAPNKTIVSDWNSQKEYGYNIETTTYQGLSREYDKNPETRYDSDFDIIILDEVHHMGYDSDEEKGALSWGRAIENIMSQNVKTIGLSATPERSDGIDVAKYFDGCVCEGMAIDEAIEKNIVHPFSYITAVYDTDGIIDEFKEENDDPTYKKLIGELNTAVENAPAIETIIKKYIGDLDPKTRKGILFVQNTSQIPSVIETVQRCFPTLKIRELHSGLTADEIVNNREWFKNTENGFIVAINMISEGAHYSGVNTIMMFRQTSSYLLYLQQIGRAVTLSSKEDPKTIVFDFVNNIHTIGDYYDTDTYETSLPRKILKAIREKAEKHISTQIIVSDESEDIVRCLKKIKEYDDDSWEDWAIEILQKYYIIEGALSCWRRIDEEWECKYPGSLTRNQSMEFVTHHRSLNAIMREANKLGLYKPQGNWTEDEDAILSIYYKSEGEQAFSRLPNRSISALRSRVQKLNLQKHFTWTAEEDAILITNYPKEGTTCFAKLPERTDSACRNRVCILGLSVEIGHTGTTWSEEELEILRLHYPNEGTAIAARLPGRTSETIKRYARLYGVKYIGPKRHTGQKRVKCIETGIVYSSAKEAATVFNISYKMVQACASGIKKSGGGYHWEYVDDK